MFIECGSMFTDALVLSACGLFNVLVRIKRSAPLLLIDDSFTSHCIAPTGVQRVTREIYRQLAGQGKGLPVCFDRWHGCWRNLNQGEREQMDSPSVAGYVNRRYRWSIKETTVGAFSRLFPPIEANTRLPGEKFGGLVVPEKLESRTAGEIRVLRPQLSEASVAVFHDLIPVKFPEYATRRSTVQFPRYLESLSHCDI
jgi:hypothetical protein